jgi:rhomboid protease GluP
MEMEIARIPARSRQQAMDWSLVLLSQGIESTIDYTEQDAPWGLLVSGADHGRAREAIRLYRLENPRWPWQREVLRAGLVFDWGSLAWAGLAVVFYWMSARVDLRSVGMMDAVAAAHGQRWRLFTAVWLHADLGHLATNLVFGTLLLGLAMGIYGTGIGALAAYLAGVGGNLVAWRLSPEPHLGLGASGMVMGALGLLAVHSLVLWRKTPHANKILISGLCGGVMLFLLLGVTPGTDVLAHAGGFAFGLVLGGCLSAVRAGRARPIVNLGAGLGFALLVVLPWWRALTSAG